jgi:hypothetical protein
MGDTLIFLQLAGKCGVNGEYFIAAIFLYADNSA